MFIEMFVPDAPLSVFKRLASDVPFKVIYTLAQSGSALTKHCHLGQDQNNQTQAVLSATKVHSVKKVCGMFRNVREGSEGEEERGGYKKNEGGEGFREETGRDGRERGCFKSKNDNIHGDG